MRSRRALGTLASAALLLLAGCSGPVHGAGPGAQVVASFYPLQFAVGQVGKNLGALSAHGSCWRPGSRPS